MYSVLVTSFLALNTTTPQFGGWLGGSGCAGCQGCYGGAVGYRVPVTYAVGFGVPNPSVAAPPCGCAAPALAGPIVPPAGLGEAISLPGAPPAPGLGVETPPPPLATGPGTLATVPDRATIVITMPADGKLFINGQPSDLPGTLRVFQTPPLEAGKEYDYELLMVVERGGKKHEVKETTKPFRAGRVVRVEFGEPGPGTAARIKVRMPDGAALTVDDQPITLAAGSNAFRTPPLEPGRIYHYTLKLSLDRGGQRQTLARDVAFRAGEEVTVDFADVLAGRIAKN